MSGNTLHHSYTVTTPPVGTDQILQYECILLYKTEVAFSTIHACSTVHSPVVMHVGC